MTITLDFNKALNILNENNITNLWVSDNHDIIGLYLYLKFIHTFEKDLIQLKSFDKIPNIKFIRLCTNKINYDDSYPTGSAIGLRQAKDLIDGLYNLGFIISGSELYKEIPNGRMLSTNINNSYIITDIGILLYQKLEKCISPFEEIELALIKTSLIVPDIFDRIGYRNNFNEKFIETYLDYIYYGGLHV